jgi:hypothetical protein
VIYLHHHSSPLTEMKHKGGTALEAQNSAVHQIYRNSSPVGHRAASRLGNHVDVCAEDRFSGSLVTRDMSCSVHRFDPWGRTMGMLQLHLQNTELSLLLVGELQHQFMELRIIAPVYYATKYSDFSCLSGPQLWL